VSRPDAHPIRAKIRRIVYASAWSKLILTEGEEASAARSLGVSVELFREARAMYHSALPRLAVPHEARSSWAFYVSPKVKEAVVEYCQERRWTVSAFIMTLAHNFLISNRRLKVMRRSQEARRFGRKMTASITFQPQSRGIVTALSATATKMGISMSHLLRCLVFEVFGGLQPMPSRTVLGLEIIEHELLYRVPEDPKIEEVEDPTLEERQGADELPEDCTEEVVSRQASLHEGIERR